MSQNLRISEFYYQVHVNKIFMCARVLKNTPIFLMPVANELQFKAPSTK